MFYFILPKTTSIQRMRGFRQPRSRLSRLLRSQLRKSTHVMENGRPDLTSCALSNLHPCHQQLLKHPLKLLQWRSRLAGRPGSRTGENVRDVTLGTQPTQAILCADGSLCQKYTQSSWVEDRCSGGWRAVGIIRPLFKDYVSVKTSKYSSIPSQTTWIRWSHLAGLSFSLQIV